MQNPMWRPTATVWVHEIHIVYDHAGARTDVVLETPAEKTAAVGEIQGIEY